MSEEGILEKIQSCARKFKQKVKTILLKCVECNLFGSDKFDDKSDDDEEFSHGHDLQKETVICVPNAYHGPNGHNGTLNFNAMNANRRGGGKKDGSDSDNDSSDGTKSKSKEGDMKMEGGKDKNGGKKKGGGFLGLGKKGLFGFGAKSGS